jgi:DNA-binding NarL/FixJ family response regulator
MLLKLEPDIEVVGMAEDGDEVIEIVAREKPDLVLMDLKMPVLNGVEATRQIRKNIRTLKSLY